MSKPAARPPAPLPHISEDTIRKMVDAQEAKIALELKHAELSLREIDHNQKIADKSIEAQAEDRKDQRRLQRAMHTQRMGVLVLTLLCVVGFMGAAMWMGKDALASDVLKIVLGGLGGWGINAASQKKSSKGDRE